MNGRGKLDRFLLHDGGFAIVPPSLCHRYVIVPPSLPPSLPPSFVNVEGQEGVYFWGMARIRPLKKNRGL